MMNCLKLLNTIIFVKHFLMNCEIQKQLYAT